jgi:hypothetical protein
MIGKLFKHGVQLGFNKIAGKKLAKSGALVGSGYIVLKSAAALGLVDLAAFTQDETVLLALGLTWCVNALRQFIARQITE